MYFDTISGQLSHFFGRKKNPDFNRKAGKKGVRIVNGSDVMKENDLSLRGTNFFFKIHADETETWA